MMKNTKRASSVNLQTDLSVQDLNEYKTPQKPYTKEQPIRLPKINKRAYVKIDDTIAKSAAMEHLRN